MPILIEERIHRYTSWRERIPVMRPLIGLLWEPDIPPLPEMLAGVGIGNEVTPDDIHPETFTPYVENWHLQDAQLISDAIQPFSPAFGMPWVEAIAGCRVMAYPGSLWAEPSLNSYDQRLPIEFDPDNPWLKVLISFTRELVKCSAGRFPIALPQMRGPLDTLAALRSPNQMCIDFLEAPEQVSRILGELTDLWIGIAEAVLAEIPPFHGGYCTRMKMWAPGKAITPQNDVSTLISPRMYQEFVSPWDQEIFGRFPFHSFHLHSTEYRHIDTLLGSPQLTAIQLTLDQESGEVPLEKMLGEAERILTKKPLILVPLDLQTADFCLQRLSLPGLAVMVGLNSAEIPREYRDWLKAHCQVNL